MARVIPEHAHPTPGPSNIPKISGTQPGVLDPTQRSRLLRLHDAKLSFAAFDPLTAYAQESPDITKLNLNTELYRPKRVVIETAPSGESTWRFVPSAKREEGVADEGTWPRVVDLCGEFVEMTQDQWDIYKLDPLYECLVRGLPQVTTIRNVSQPRPSSPKIIGKRQLPSRSPSPCRLMPPPRTANGRNTFVESESESDDEGEVESMIIHDQQPRSRHRSATRELRERLKKERQERREKLQRKMEIFSQTDELYHNVYPNGSLFDRARTPERCSTTPEPSKRKATSVLDASWSPDTRELEESRIRNGATYAATVNMKRTRTSVSPTRAKRELWQKRMERVRGLWERRTAEVEARRLERERRLLDEIMEDVPLGDFSPNDNPTTSDNPFSQQTQTQETQTQEGMDEELLDEEAAHRAAIEESRRKLAELERDRPLWEEQAKQRQLREEAEQRALRAEAEERLREVSRKKAEAEAQERRKREQEETKKREQEKSLKQERELREQERRQRQQRWSFGPWTTQRALERYRVLSEAFDNTKFTSELPLSFEDVPWPTLQPPKGFSIEDVNWDSVERFFEAIRPHLRLHDYKTLVEKSHRRFHPDRWRSRGLLKTVEDEAMRGCMEVAANTVAQALTPLWRSLTGR